MGVRSQLACAATIAFAALSAHAQSPDALYVRSIAASCAACHGTDGRTVDTSAVSGLAGMPRDYMLRQLRSFKDGSRPATVMHQIARGFTEPQLEQIAGYFAAQKK